MRHIIYALIIAGILSTSFVITDNAFAVSSKFRKQFVFNRRANMLRQQEHLIKMNKEKVPEEVRLFIKDALSHKRTFEERMYLLDHAQAMATMYGHETGDHSFSKEIKTIQRMEVNKKEEAEVERKKWSAYKGLRGSMLLKEHLKQMEAAGQEAVVFPHQLHRALFQCRACHPDTTVMKRDSNDFTHAKFDSGAQCGSCHNGEVSFSVSAEADCARCHLPGEAETAAKYEELDHDIIKSAATRLGIEYHPENLPDGEIPLDSRGEIDWTELKALGVTSPAPSSDRTVKLDPALVKKGVIVFTPGEYEDGEGVPHVPFSHEIHSSRINCQSCHTSIFNNELGSNEVNMNEMAMGRTCGVCHGKVSFPLTDCSRCHTLTPGEVPEGAIIRD